MTKLTIAGGLAILACLFTGCEENYVDRGQGNRGHLSSVRSALQNYYSDSQGVFPGNLEMLTKDGKYLKELPTLHLPGHPETNEVLYLDSPDINPGLLTDTGGYVYYNSGKHSKTWGSIFINCTHQDAKSGPVYYW